MGRKRNEHCGQNLFENYLEIFFPETGIEGIDPNEFPTVCRIIINNVGELLDRLVNVFGLETIEVRLQDLASHNPIAGKIPIAYIPKPEHSHNILVGVPYTGVFAGRFPQLGSIVAHEFSHITFGKFNDGLTEPIASLFLGVANTGGPEPRDNDGARRRPPLNPLQFLTLAALELFQQGVRLADLCSLEDLFSHRPLDRNVAAARYEYEKQRHHGDPVEAAKATQDFVRSHVAVNYHMDFRTHLSLGIQRPADDDVAELNHWLVTHAVDAFAGQQRNPNESSGVVRNLHGAFDTTLMNYLLEKGLDGMSLDSITPEIARESIRKLFEFYYSPTIGLQEYGYRDFQQLENEMRDTFQVAIDALDDGQLFAWFQMKDNMRESPCYQPGTWNNDFCRPSRGFGSFGEPVIPFLDLMFPPFGPSSPRPLNQIIATAIEGAAPSEPLISFTEKLGANLDFETYFALP